MISAAVCAVVKMLYLSSYGKHGDFLFDSSEITIWTTVEVSIAIVAACAPCLKPLFREILQSASMRSTGRSRPGRRGYVEHSYSGHGGAAYGKSAERKSADVHMGYLGRVTGGDASEISRRESLEAIILRPESAFAVNKTVSVSVV